MAWYPNAVRRELPQSKTQGSITPRSIALHTAVSNASSLYAFFNGRSNGVESHFYVKEDGSVEQYVDTARRADCQLDGNAYAISIETWDGAGRAWDGRTVSKLPESNARQVDALVALMSWICRTHSIPAAKCPSWDGRGVGYHQQFTGGAKRWNESHACPGPARIRQVPGLISKVAAVLNASAATPSTSATTYTVRIGDTLAKIAAQHGVTVDAIVAANNLPNPDRITLGQVLTIPAPAKGGDMATPADVWNHPLNPGPTADRIGGYEPGKAWPAYDFLTGTDAKLNRLTAAEAARYDDLLANLKDTQRQVADLARAVGDLLARTNGGTA